MENRLPLWLAAALLLLVVCGSGQAAENPGRELVTAFWQAESAAAQDAAQQALLAATDDVATLYGWLQQGPAYSSAVETGAWEASRTGTDGQRYRYGVVVPDSYDPALSYPVEFLLHGGVSRPEWDAGVAWWRSGYENLQQEDRIIVVPASWREAFWWHDNQADNLPAILREVKRRYNVDDNRVTMSGVSDGGTGAYFFAFKQPGEWAAFLPWIGHPGVLRNPAGGVNYRLYFENLTAKPLYIVNGELDRLYPAASMQSFIAVLEEAGVEHVFRVIEGGGHDTRWLPEETPAMEQFKSDHPRDPLSRTAAMGGGPGGPLQPQPLAANRCDGEPGTPCRGQSRARGQSLYRGSHGGGRIHPVAQPGRGRFQRAGHGGGEWRCGARGNRGGKRRNPAWLGPGFSRPQHAV